MTFYEAPDDPSPDVMPEDRHLDYPFLRYEAVQDDFETIQNRDQISRTQDQQFCLRYALEVGWSSPELGADRKALLAHAEASRGWRIGDDDSLFADLKLTTRVAEGSVADGLLTAGMRYYRPTGLRGVFFAGISGAAGHALDADHELTIGGDTGLRGYPLRFQAGSGTALMTLEQRFFTKYSRFSIADVGAAVTVENQSIVFQNMLATGGIVNIFYFIFNIGAALVCLLSVDYTKKDGVNYGEYYILIQNSVLGMMLMAGAKSLFVIFLGLEVMSVCFYVLAGVNRKKDKAIEASLNTFYLVHLAQVF